MGFDFAIGEGFINHEDDEYIYIGVDGVKNPDAPNLGHNDISGTGNSRHPSYISFHDFATRNNIKEIFYEEDRIKGGHPGCFKITESMCLTLEERVKTFEEKHPDVVCPSTVPCTVAPEDKFKMSLCCGLTEDSWDYGKLRWYAFWFRWALNNCKIPVFHNT